MTRDFHLQDHFLSFTSVCAAYASVLTSAHNAQEIRAGRKAALFASSSFNLDRKKEELTQVIDSKATRVTSANFIVVRIPESDF
ncbi:hypothetical protein pdam_00011746 [Pocillopora damicornis]|uniref:Uncharacterized protein n=1 Tax=Pocillopora damicornis TaxID=46731 RepID=A0A3M6UDI1_POCDA|nr:hypothetical protein pdam_00011746 [Pocillopora damicornis]